MILTEKLLFGLSLACWLIPVGLAWPQRKISPLWAWIRIVPGVWLFVAFELMVWFPKTPALNWWVYTGVALYAAKFFIKRKLAPTRMHNAQ